MSTPERKMRFDEARAHRGQKMLDVYFDKTGIADYSTLCSMLIADLAHFIEKNGYPIGMILDDASREMPMRRAPTVEERRLKRMQECRDE